MKKRGFIILFSILGFLALAAGVVFYLAQSEQGHQLVVRKSLSAMEQALQAKIRIGKASGNLLGRLVWEDVSLVREDLEVRIDRLSFRVDYLALGDSHLRLTGIRALNPRTVLKTVWIEPGEEGPPPEPETGRVRESDLREREVSGRPAATPSQPSLAQAPAPAPAPEEAPQEEWRISLDGVSIENGSLTGLGQALSWTHLGPVEKLSGKFDISFTNGFGVKGRLSLLTALDGRPVRLDLDGGFQGLTLTADRLKVGFGPEERSFIELKGRYDFSDFQGQAEYLTRLEPVDLKSHLSQILPGTTDLDLMEGRFDLKGRMAHLKDLLELNLAGTWGAAAVELQAGFDPKTMKLDSRGRIADLDPARLAKVTGQEIPPGRTGFRFELKGTLPHELDLSADLEQTALEGYGRARGGRVEADWKEGQITAKIGLDEAAGFKTRVARLGVEGNYQAGTGRARAKVDFSGAEGHQVKADQGRFALDWEGDRLTLSGLDLTRDQGRLTGTLTAAFREGRIASGQADLELDGLSPPTALIWNMLGISLPVVDLASVRLTGPLKARWPGTEAEISFPGMKLESQWGLIQGPGRISLDGQGQLKEYALDLDVSRFAVPGWLWSLLPLEIKQAVINGRLKVKGDAQRAEFEADLGGTELAGESLKRFRLAGKYGPKGATLDNLDLSFLGTELQAQGNVWPALDLKTSLRGSAPDRVTAFLRKLGHDPGPLPLKVEAYDFQGTLSGNPLKPGLKGRLQTSGLAFEDYRAGSVDLDLDLKEVSLSKLGIPRGEARAVVKKLEAPGRPPLDLETSAVLSASGLEGRAKAEITGLKADTGWSLVFGSGKNLELVLKDLALTLPKGSAEETWRSRSPLRASLDQGSVKTAELHLVGPAGQSIDLDLSQADGSLTGRGRMDNLDLGSWARALRLENLDQGRLSASLELGGSLAAPSARLEGRIVGLTFLGRPAGDLDWTLTLMQGVLKADLKGREKGREFLSGTAAINRLAGTAWNEFQPDLNSLKVGLDIQGLDLAAWAAALKEDWLQAGRLFTRLELSGPPRDLRAQLKGRVEGLVVLDQGIGDLILEAVLKDRSITGQAEIRDQTLSLLKASGGIDLNRTTPDGAAYRPEWSSLKADVKVSDLDLARFGPAIKQVEGLAGRMNAEFILGPESKGWVRVEGLEFLVATTGQVVEKGNIRLGLKGSRVEIEECTAETGGGRLTGQGWLELAETIPFALSAELDKAEVLLGQYGRAQIGSKMEITQSLSQPLIQGEIKLDQLNFREPLSSPEDSDEVILVDELAQGRKPPAPPERLKMSIKLDLGRRTPIQGEGLRARVGGQLQVTKEPGKDPRISGQADFREGIYSRFGRRFIIQSGKVVFRGLENPDPSINIAATTRVNSVDIDLNIGGTARRPDYILSSRPVMEREEILAYLIFGQSASGSAQLDEGSSQARNIGILGGPATELVKGIVSERLAPDSMTVSASNRGGVAVEAGKQILPNLFFSYVAYSEPTKPNEFKIEYRFSPNVAVESSVGDPETTGVDINFKYDF